MKLSYSILVSLIYSSMENLKSILLAYKAITLEPLFFLLYLNIALVHISINDLYLAKACKVNLNYTESLCDDIHQHPQVQQTTQKYVREELLLYRLGSI